jgi:predicted secreted protein
MTVLSAFAVYFIIWWLTLFAVLPFGVRSQAESGEIAPGTDPGAPVHPHLATKLAANTLLAGIIFLLGWFAIHWFGFSLDQVPSLFPQDRQS